LTKEPKYKELQEQLREYQDVFPDDLPKRLPPERQQAFRIDLEEDAQPLENGIYRL